MSNSYYDGNASILAELTALKASVDLIKEAMVSKTALLELLNDIKDNTQPT